MMIDLYNRSQAKPKNEQVFDINKLSKGWRPKMILIFGTTTSVKKSIYVGESEKY